MYFTDLRSEHSSRKSFGGKAKIKHEDGLELALMSYNTEVLTLSVEGIQVNGYYSQTTARHINEYLQQRGFPPLSKKELEEKPFLKWGRK